MKKLNLIMVAAVLPLLISRAWAAPACVDIDDDLTRLACYDRQAGRLSRDQSAPSMTSSTREADKAVNEPRVERVAEPHIDQGSEFGLRPEKKPLGDALEATVLRADNTAHGKLLVYLGNEQVWRQLDSANLRLAEGDTVTIRSASFGSHLLEKSTGSRKIRVKRVR